MNNYSYDALHRITAMHNSLIRPGLAADNAYSTSYSYDRAGNIQHLSRRGFVGMSGATPVYDLIDDLHYSYAPGANPAANAFSSKLQGVDDVVTDAAAQPRGVFLPSSGYIPDGNGNLRTAGSVTAEYNILNLPTKLATSSGDRKFEYVYGGGKYSAQLITGNPAIDEMRHYIGGMEFKNGILEAYNFGDGRVVWENSVPKFQYRLADHLGNTVVFSARAEVLAGAAGARFPLAHSLLSSKKTKKTQSLVAASHDPLPLFRYSRSNGICSVFALYLTGVQLTAGHAFHRTWENQVSGTAIYLYQCPGIWHSFPYV